MKAVILAGGIGSRISEETILKPKPLIEIGQYPILWHILKIYSSHGINDFIICCGYKGYLIKEFFANYILHTNDVSIDVNQNKIKVLNTKSAYSQDNWKITLVDTGENTQTGGRLKKIKKYVSSTFCMTYGDGVGNIDIKNLIKFHKRNKKKATMTVVNPPGRFGTAILKKNIVTMFDEKKVSSEDWINGGFFVLEPSIFNLIDNNSTIWEAKPLKTLAKNKQLMAFRHKGFWQPMDTLRDKRSLEKLWSLKYPPWKTW